jgi:thymidylate synthase
MAIVDNIFKEMCQDILENGTDTRGEKVRPVWEDTNEPAYTIKKFGHTAMYDLRKEFPLLTLRKSPFKNPIDEILWIFQKKSNNIKDLKPHIWDAWADENGSIGKAYGYQIGQKYIRHIEHPDAYSRDVISLDQMDAVLYDLKHTPFSRRILTSVYNFKDLHEMNLYPCCWSCTFNVTDENDDKLVLNMVLNQRSNDVLAANNWNVVQYSALLMMIAQSVNMIPGKLLHVIADAHIYDRHVDLVKELINRTPYPAPTVKLNPDVKDFYKFTTDDFELSNYQAGDPIKNIPIAV